MQKFLLSTLVFALLSCGQKADPAALKNQATVLGVQLFEPPLISWDAEHAATHLVVKFVARGSDGMPMGADDMDVEMLLDGLPLDSEAVSAKSAKAREVNLLCSMVLDATRSLLVTQPPGFEPMKQAAQESIQTATRLWSSRPGHFGWGVTWFDDFIYRPDALWPQEAITSIPAPGDGLDFTRLYSAIDYALDDLPRLAVATDLLEAHKVLVVFSDGKDNHSHWNMPVQDEWMPRDGNLSYRKIAWPAVALADLVIKIRASGVTLHAIGVGPEVDDGALTALAQAGHGIYVKKQGNDSVATLFQRVSQEFTTIQTVAAAIPNAPGDHLFSVLLRPRRGAAAQGRLEFSVHVGDETARLL